ncbi:hypothetical protein EMIT0P218_40344 [Pseudomonas sp. IT-P218]
MLAIGHEVCRNAFAIEPTVPGFTSGRDDAASTDGDDVDSFHVVRHGYSFRQANRLASIAHEKSCLFHLGLLRFCWRNKSKG